MIRTQFIYAFRTISRNKPWFVINVIGFSVAFALTFLIFSWAAFEFSYDNFYKNRDRIFRVIEKQNFQGQDEHYLAQIPEYFANTFEKEIPGIKTKNFLGKKGNWGKKRKLEVLRWLIFCFWKKKGFKIFAFRFVAGDSGNALTEPLTAVLTQSVAKKLFGGNDVALGKTLALENKKTYTVKGVIQDMPGNSHLQFNILISLEERRPGWNYNNGNHNASRICSVEAKRGRKIA